MKKNPMKLTTFLSAVALAACGGGGGSSPAPSVGSGLTPAASTGAITGFGSIIVNGKEFRTDNATFDINQQSNHTQNDLSAGSIVTISGKKDANRNFTADRVHYQAEVEGLVTAVDTAGNSLTVLGQTITVNAATVFVRVTDLSGLKVNDVVEVSGGRDSNGTIVASLVKKETVASSTVELHGVTSAFDASAHTFKIGQQTVDFSKSNLTPTGATLATGLAVAVQGTLDAVTGNVLASRIHVERSGENVESGAESELEGAIQTAASDFSSFTVNNVTVLVDATTKFADRHTKSDLVAGARVEVEGTAQSDGTVKATQIEFHVNNAQAASVAAGAVSNVDQTAKTFTLLGLKLTATPSTEVGSDDDDHQFKFSSLMNGDRVLAGFTPSGTVLNALKIQRLKNERQTVRDAVRSTTVVTDQPNGKLTIATVPVVTSSSTNYFVAGKSTDANGFFTAAGMKGAVVSGTGVYDATKNALAATEVSVLKTDSHGAAHP